MTWLCVNGIPHFSLYIISSLIWFCYFNCRLKAICLCWLFLVSPPTLNKALTYLFFFLRDSSLGIRASLIAIGEFSRLQICLSANYKLSCFDPQIGHQFAILGQNQVSNVAPFEIVATPYNNSGYMYLFWFC